MPSSRRSKRTASTVPPDRVRGSGRGQTVGKDQVVAQGVPLSRGRRLCIIYNFTGGTVQLEDPPVPEEHQVLFGVRSCDASGLVRLDEIFLSGTRDRLYAARRENTTVVSTACAAADPECFCTAVGYSPVGEEGSDVQLVPLGEGWMVRVLTDKGRDLVGDAGDGWTAATAKDGKRHHGAREKRSPSRSNGARSTGSGRRSSKRASSTVRGTGSPNTVWAAACVPTCAPPARAST